VSVLNEERRLLSAAKRFDRDALAEIYDLYQAELYRYAYRQLGNPQQAEDCVSETFSRFLAALRGGKGPRKYLRAYLFRIAHNWISDQYRRTPPTEVQFDLELLADNHQDLEETVISGIAQDRVRASLALLTPDQRQVIILKFLEGWRNDEIAAALGKPVGAVKSLQHRGLAALRRILLKEDEVIA
jgi:RNA polymerase sigma-70 factor (ECF subfamily)